MVLNRFITQLLIGLMLQSTYSGDKLFESGMMTLETSTFIFSHWKRRVFKLMQDLRSTFSDFALKHLPNLVHVFSLGLFKSCFSEYLTEEQLKCSSN